MEDQVSDTRIHPIMPIHPITGLTALGFGRRGPIWPVMGGAPDGEGEGAGGEGGGGGEGAKTFTQEQLDRIVGERLGQERAKYPDYDKYKSAADELSKIKDADKSADQRFADMQQQLADEKAAREKAEADRDADREAIKVAQLRQDRAAATAGFPKSLTKRLTGTTTEEVDTEIGEIMADLGLDGDRRPDGSGGGSRSGGNEAKPTSAAAGAALYEKLHPKK